MTSQLELRAALVRDGYAHLAATLATPCPSGHAPAGRPCGEAASPALDAAGSICVHRAFAAAHRGQRLGELARDLTTRDTCPTPQAGQQ